MDRGMDFLRSQVNNAVMQHRSFCDALRDHEEQAEDSRYRELCARFRPIMEGHQRMIEEYARRIEADQAGSTAKTVLGKAAGMARDLADMGRESDFLRLVGDIVMSRQAEDTFRTFREAGRMLGDVELQRIGEECERDHDAYADAANRLVQQMFVEHVRDVAPGQTAAASTTRRTGTTGTQPETRL